MGRRVWAWFLAILTFFTIIGLALTFKFASFGPASSEEKDCIDVNSVSSFIYEVCYDSLSKNLFVDLKREKDNYRVVGILFSFFDFSKKEYPVTDVPEIGEKRVYKIPALRNPRSLDVSLDIIKDFSSPVCDKPRTLFVDYCPNLNKSKGINSRLKEILSSNTTKVVELGRKKDRGFDIIPLSLAEKEAIWKSVCESKWECSSWSECNLGVQKRICRDLNNCPVSVLVPETVRVCQESCVENWQCEWSSCVNGYTTPRCRDLNSCGTTKNLPKKLRCIEKKEKCSPDIVCGEWSSCRVKYGFGDVTGNSILEPIGVQSRMCRDLNGCIADSKETRKCPLSVDVYTKRIRECGVIYEGIYNKINDQLLAKIEIGTEDNPYFNIDLAGKEREECSYCFNGILDGDETGIDCGGGCIPCSEKYPSKNATIR